MYYLIPFLLDTLPMPPLSPHLYTHTHASLLTNPLLLYIHIIKLCFFVHFKKLCIWAYSFERRRQPTKKKGDEIIGREMISGE
jgi:hypothetical protein